MWTTVPRPWLPFSAAMLVGLPPSTVFLAAQDKVDFFVECEGGLVTAAGVIGPRHDYEFNGECTLWRMVQPEDPDEMQALLEDGMTWRHDKAMVRFPTRGRGTWERESGQAKESLEFLGPVTGTTIARGACLRDPFLEAAPCRGVMRQTSVAGGPYLDRVISFFAVSKYFRFGNQFSLAEAQALSGQHPPKSPPPPPPAKSPPVVEQLALKYIVIGENEHVVRVTLRGAKPITARLSRGRSLVRPLELDDPHPGSGIRSAALRLPAAAAQTPGVLTITLANPQGSARVELLACPANGAGGPKGCPIHVRAGASPPTTVGAPAAPAGGGFSETYPGGTPTPARRAAPRAAGTDRSR